MDDFLIVMVETFRHRVVQHEAHIRPVELEKRIRRHDEDPGACAESPGIRHPLLAGQTCVVGERWETAAIEQLCDVLRQTMLCAVDDACFAFMAAQKIEEKRCLALWTMHRQKEIQTFELMPDEKWMLK